MEQGVLPQEARQHVGNVLSFIQPFHEQNEQGNRVARAEYLDRVLKMDRAFVRWPIG